ncbi:MAG: glucose-6-phosphate dehydrogenase [Candidatus Babeliales bacterium]
MNDCTIVLLGASGDLAKRKLIPALYELIAHNTLTNFVVVGAAYDDTTAEHILEQAKPFITAYDQTVFDRLRERFVYQRVNFLKPDDFIVLEQEVTALERTYGLLGNRIIYVAAASHFFIPITQAVAAAGLARKLGVKDKTWHRIVYEKPFGEDAKTAHEINQCIAHYFDEIQIYRIDHYLTKEIVGNIALVRFTNCVFEPLWNNRYIDNVQIVLSEKIGLDGRGAYYDHYGALKDMVQNHVLELMALIGMESPEKLTGEYIRKERIKVLEKIKVIDAVLGQYEGYHTEPHVDSHSKTETFATALCMIENPRWAGVPFYIKTGKYLDKKETAIYIKFKQVDCLLTRNCPSDSNYLSIEVSPEAKFSLRLNVKKPGLTNDVTPVDMEFCHSCLFGPITPEAYEVIFEEVMKGEQSISVRCDEIEYAWKVIDAIKAMNLPVYTYARGLRGPQEADQFARKHGMRWRS